MAAMGQLKGGSVHFEPCQSVNFGGVLTLVPFLLSQGLLSYRKYYTGLPTGYYDFDSVLLTLAFIYLCRIKSIEQLKHYPPGEFGKLLGLDRIPEAKCIRGKLKEMTIHEKAFEWNMYLSRQWMNPEEPLIFYIDGHVKVYHGYLANLGKKHVSRQKLCLPGITEFWVNNAQGQPYFFIAGQVNEKLQEIIKEEIIERLIELTMPYIDRHRLEQDPELPIFTIVFDREAYSPAFFAWLWNEYRISVITYRKNVKEQWIEEDFKPYTIETEVGQVIMELCEKEIEVNGFKMREVRERSEDGHQTSVVTTNRKLNLVLIAIYMFNRWLQENFFRYMRQEYDIDRIIQYGVDQLNEQIKVVNPEYNKLNYYLKKLREKIGRRKAQLFNLENQNIPDEFEKTGQYMANQVKVNMQLEKLLLEKQELIEKRKKIPYKITIAQMPEQTRYTKLKTESKHIQNIIKIICYKAETALANLLAIDYKRKTNEMRALVKSLVKSKADILPDYQNNTLTIAIYSLATPRDNKAIKQICNLLNDTETIFPGTNLKLFYKIATI
jgi:hypothetical protein